ncbi:DUF72 domain-containing protein [Lysobacter sp. A03]|uniref:DUF72 domain-containing protein n=1 Tax=Lysobacter sp. A03 TaxID=1199154 RepID=UPI0005B6F711|nr:DUF72 domain-containing protein [Lysobacter sp. A03]KIQ96304.1 hypothetical protein TI01_2153 [Lysobacter sp. A03]
MSDVRAPTPTSSVRIGCAGWSIPTRTARLFGAGESHLERYATRFDVVEINSSFYRPHQAKTYRRWADTVPPGFRFSVKLPRQITHEARLADADRLLGEFLDQVSGLGPKLGGILVQLPPSLGFDARVAEGFFGMMRRSVDTPIACEPRHSSWFGIEAAELWDAFSITRVAADPARLPEAGTPAGPKSARWSYWRLHGSPRMYYSSYEDAVLQKLAPQLLQRGRARSPAWCIFDNTAGGHAVEDAARLQALVARDTTP